MEGTRVLVPARDRQCGLSARVAGRQSTIIIRIVDPRDCDLGFYSFTTFYYYAPKGGVRTASLGDWSNPNWHA
jgi:hypothetical protein